MEEIKLKALRETDAYQHNERMKKMAIDLRRERRAKNQCEICEAPNKCPQHCDGALGPAWMHCPICKQKYTDIEHPIYRMTTGCAKCLYYTYVTYDAAH